MTNKIKIEVPDGIRFLSDWEDFRLNSFPAKCIINKQIPGCGFTEYCINGPENVILCSPRKLLLENKWDQHQGEVYLVRNEMDKDPDVDKDISKERKNQKSQEIVKETNNSEIYQRIYNEIQEYYYYRFSNNLPIKILVTYDSYRIVQQILMDMGIFQNFYTVVDEFQSILHDSRFKSDTEMSFMNYLRRSHSALFVSATPMMDEYLEMLSEFRNLQYFELDWYAKDPTRVIRPSLKVLTMKSVNVQAREIIEKYLRGEFDSVVVMRNGVPTKIISDEAVIYVNSVNHIISIIKKCELYPDQVNILCANTEDNRKRIKARLGKDYDIGKVPKEGEYHKMFTFCTRTVYLGADFYSLCAQTFILSDSNSDCLAVDIEEDLPQILGRQRLFENPWKSSATFYYRYTADYKKMSAEELQNIINSKKKKTEELIRIYENTSDNSSRCTLAKTYEENIRAYSYKNNYVAINRIVNDVTGDVILKPVINELVLVNELRAFKIQQIDYADRFTVFATIHNKITPDDIANRKAMEFMENYNNMTEARKKMIYLCECGLSRDVIQIVLDQIPDSDYIKSYYQILGPERLKALGYKRNNIERALGIITFSPELLKQEIYSSFREGEKLSLVYIKNLLSSIYSSVNYQSTPKATDLGNYFELKECLVPVIDSDGNKKRVRGYELLRSKRNPLEERLVD